MLKLVVFVGLLFHNEDEKNHVLKRLYAAGIVRLDHLKHKFSVLNELLRQMKHPLFTDEEIIKMRKFYELVVFVERLFKPTEDVVTAVDQIMVDMEEHVMQKFADINVFDRETLKTKIQKGILDDELCDHGHISFSPRTIELFST